MLTDGNSATPVIGFSESAMIISISREGGIEYSNALKKLFKSHSCSPEKILSRISSIPDGYWPAYICGDYFLMSVFRMTPDSGHILLKQAGSRDLTMFLDSTFGSDATILSDSDGKVLASSSSFDKGTDVNSIADMLDSVSRLALLSAMEDCSTGKVVHSFTVNELDSGRTFVLDLRMLPVPGNLVLIHLSDPSMSMTSYTPAEACFIETIFRNMPTPAIRMDEQGIIINANEPARMFFMDRYGEELESTCFHDWVLQEDRDRMSSLHKNRMDGMYVPFRCITRLLPVDGKAVPCEVSALRLPDVKETMVFLIPEPLKQEGHEGPDSFVSLLLSMLESVPQDEDLFRWTMEFIRTGTGACGATCRQNGRTVTVGDVQMDPDFDWTDTSTDESWTGNEQGLYDLTYPVRYRYGLLNLKLFGLPADRLQPVQNLILKLFPLLIGYANNVSYVRKTMKSFSSIIDFWAILSESQGNLGSIIERIAAISSSDGILVSILNVGEAVLRPLAGYGFGDELPDLLLQQDSVASWAYTHNELTYLADSGKDSRFVPVFQGKGSELAVPLIRDGQPIGTLVVCSRQSGAFETPIPGLISMMGTAISLWLFSGGNHAGDREKQETGAGRTEKVQMDALLLSLSHRFRSPLAAIRGYIDLLLSGKTGEITEEQANCLNTMNRSISDLVEQSERLLTFMRIELQEETVDSSWAQPSDLISSLLPILEEKGRLNDIGIVTEFPEQPFTACFDRARMEQIITNLVDNAIQFNKPGGEVRISVKPEDQFWILEVSDTGKGIDSSDLPFVFDRFYTTEDTGETGKRLGIGLAIVKHFTELLGGVVSVWSRKDTGSKFILRFPVSG